LGRRKWFGFLALVFIIIYKDYLNTSCVFCSTAIYVLSMHVDNEGAPAACICITSHFMPELLENKLRKNDSRGRERKFRMSQGTNLPSSILASAAASLQVKIDYSSGFEIWPHLDDGWLSEDGRTIRKRGPNT
jgi:hypothetical protein